MSITSVRRHSKNTTPTEYIVYMHHGLGAKSSNMLTRHDEERKKKQQQQKQHKKNCEINVMLHAVWRYTAASETVHRPLFS